MLKVERVTTSTKINGRDIIITDNVIDITPEVKNVYFNDPATVVKWSDGSKTVVVCQKGDTYSTETGLAMCIAKKALGKKEFGKLMNKYCNEPTIIPQQKKDKKKK